MFKKLRVINSHANIKCFPSNQQQQNGEKDDSTSIVFTLKEEIGALARALKLFEVCTEKILGFMSYSRSRKGGFELKVVEIYQGCDIQYVQYWTTIIHSDMYVLRHKFNGICRFFYLYVSCFVGLSLT